MAVTGTSATTLNNHTSSATGSVSITGTSATTLEDYTSSGLASVPITGTATPTLDDFASASVGSVPYTASPAMTTEAFTSSGTGIFSHKEAFLDDGQYTWTCIITGTPDATTDLEVPISSLNFSYSFSERDFVSVEIPTNEYWAEINARPNGQLQIKSDVLFSDGTTLPAPLTLLTADIDELTFNESQGSAKVVIKGRINNSYNAANTVPIDKVFEVSLDANGYKAKAYPVLAIRPYDIAHLNDGNETKFAVGRVSYSIGPSTAEMSLEEISDDQEDIKSVASAITYEYTFYIKGRSYNTL